MDLMLLAVGSRTALLSRVDKNLGRIAGSTSDESVESKVMHVVAYCDHD
jgi:hypothetical protein